MKALLCLMLLFTVAYADEPEFDDEQAYYETKQFYSGEEVYPYRKRQFYSDGEVNPDNERQFYSTPEYEPNIGSLLTDQELEEILMPKVLEKLEAQLME